MRYLAIDLGQKRTGLAVGSDVTCHAEPVRVIHAHDDDARLDAVAETIADYAPDALVVGLPINMDDTEGPAARAARHFAQHLEQRFNLPVHLVDERLTSDAADAEMAGTGLTRDQKKRLRDALAAAAILRTFFGRQP